MNNHHEPVVGSATWACIRPASVIPHPCRQSSYKGKNHQSTCQKADASCVQQALRQRGSHARWGISHWMQFSLLFRPHARAEALHGKQGGRNTKGILRTHEGRDKVAHQAIGACNLYAAPTIQELKDCKLSGKDASIAPTAGGEDDR